MGKGSLLKKDKEYVSNGNGRRKEWDTGREFLDPDAPPAGSNTDIWHLALYFRDKAEQFDVALTTRTPVIYSLLQKALTKLTPPGILARVRDTTGIEVPWVSIVERSIDEYFDNESTVDINNYSSKFMFGYYVQRAIDTIIREDLVTTGKLVPQQDIQKQPSKRTQEQKEFHQIMDRQYTEEELLQKMRDFRSRN